VQLSAASLAQLPKILMPGTDVDADAHFVNFVSPGTDVLPRDSGMMCSIDLEFDEWDLQKMHVIFFSTLKQEPGVLRFVPNGSEFEFPFHGRRHCALGARSVPDPMGR